MSITAHGVWVAQRFSAAIKPQNLNSGFSR